jgi:mannose-6-phosphate isomerase-like protein (cupin superfamily)
MRAIPHESAVLAVGATASSATRMGPFLRRHGHMRWTIDGAKLHYHKRSTELYYVLDGSGSVILEGVEQPVSKGSLVHIPPGVVHGARGRMRVLVAGIPDIADDDYYEAPDS